MDFGRDPEPTTWDIAKDRDRFLNPEEKDNSQEKETSKNRLHTKVIKDAKTQDYYQTNKEKLPQIAFSPRQHPRLANKPAIEVAAQR